MAAAFPDQIVQSSFNDVYSVEPDVMLNGLLQDKSDSPDSSICVCKSCDEGATATSRCSDCNEYLCDNCVKAHLRVRLTKDHCIMKLSGSPIALSPFSKNSISPTQSTSSNSKSISSNVCEIHLNEALQYYCENCSTNICAECAITLHRGHSYICTLDNDGCFQLLAADSCKLLVDAKSGARAVKESLEINQKMIENVNFRANTIRCHILTVMNRIHTALKEREAELISKVEHIRNAKTQVLNKQVECLRNSLTYFISFINQLSEAIQCGTTFDLYNIKMQILEEFKNLSTTINVSLSPQEDDNINFYFNDTGMLKALASFGDISCVQPPPPPIGEQFHDTRKKFMSSLSLVPKNPLELANTGGSSNLFKTSSFVNPNNNVVPLDSGDRLGSSYLCPPGYNWNYNNDSPSGMNSNRLLVPALGNVQRYGNTGGAILIFGREGSADGELCRPWGICCDRKGNIIVADRSNNRIQIFSKNGSFLYKFGSHGSEPGQFDRPAGVATNPADNIVVADKDNHRIQIFTHDGQFIFTFGDKGSKTGQFNYPWDVDCNTLGQIVVSDTRNHRIQIFGPDGSFISKYGFENSTNMWKHFDSPRGVCFSSDSRIIVTDFNNHRLVVIESNCQHARFLGSEGTGIKQFVRPQGIVVNQDGHIVVADSRNNRIQIFDHSGNFVWKFGSQGKEPGQLDRPSGICLTPDGNIVVVDFGNSRIQLF